MKARVLYVDDDANNLKALERLLDKEPYHLITFDSPEKALEKLGEIKPAVVISDYRMPEMDGTVFLKKVKERRPETVRIILTGHSDMEVAISAINQGNVFRFIRKPWQDGELRSEIVSALEYHDLMAGLAILEKNGVHEAVVERARKKGFQELAARIRREMAQPMAVLAGYTRLLEDYGKNDTLLKTYVSNIAAQIKSMDQIIAEMAAKGLKSNERG